MSFDWQTEEESWPEPERSLRRYGRRRWPLLLAPLLVFLLGAAWLIRGRLEQRVSTVSGAITVDVETSVRIVRQAGAASDVELLITVLSGEDAAWAELMQRQLLAGELFRRDALGLSWQPEQSRVVSVTLSADLLQADVLVDDAYAVAVGRGQSESVWLRRHEIYRRGRERWLLAPKGREVAEVAPYAGSILHVALPTDEASVARRLAVDLDRRLLEACGSLRGLDCPGALSVALSDDPASMAALASFWQIAPTPDTVLLLPSPAVVGAPVDEAAYRALLRGYARPIFARLLMAAAGERCCTPPNLAQAFVRQQLVELGLDASLTTPTTFQSLLVDPLALWRHGTLGTELNEQAGIDELAALVQFLHAGPGAPSLPELMTTLAAAPGLAAWTRQQVTHSGSFWVDWAHFLADRAGATNGAPTGLSAAPVTMCAAADTIGMPLSLFWRLDPGTGDWVESLAIPGLPPPTLAPLPDGRGLILLTVAPDGQRTEPLLWPYAGNPRLVELPATMPTAATITFDRRDQDWLFFSVLDSRGRPAGMARLDGAACAAGACSFDYFPDGLVTIWSPDRRHSLLSEAPWPLREDPLPRQLLQADGDRQRFQSIGAGSHPFWLDDERFGFVQLSQTSDRPDPEIIVASVGDPSPVTWIEASNLREALAGLAGPDPLRSTGLWSRPGQDPMVVLQLEYAADLTAWVALDGEAEIHLLVAPAQALEEVRFAPDGNGVVLKGEVGGVGRSIWFQDLAAVGQAFSTIDAQVAPSLTWSPDGAWLAVDHGPYFTLLGPDGATHVVNAPNAACGELFWASADSTSAIGTSP